MRTYKRWIKQALARRGYYVGRLGDCNVFDFLLEMRLQRRGRLDFVQIGANDGKTDDPIHDFVKRNAAQVRGLVLEPVGEYFEALCRTYRDHPGITPLRLAIHETERKMTIHRVDPRKQPSLAKRRAGVASFDPVHHERTGVPASAMTRETVDCVPLSELLEQHGSSELDVLLIDAEGYDGEIVRGIDFSAIRPAIIRFEHGRLQTMAPATFRELCVLLRGQGYELAIEPRDATAYLPEIVLERLQPHFRQSDRRRASVALRGP